MANGDNYIRDVTDRMSKGIREHYCRYAIKKEEEDNPATGSKFTEWEILWSFMEEQVEMSRRLTRSSSFSREITDVIQDCHQRNVANSVTTKDKQAEFSPCSVCQEIHPYTHSSGVEKNAKRFYDCRKFRSLDLEDPVKLVPDSGGCVRCTSRTHTRDFCSSKIDCGVSHSANHHYLLHGSSSASVNHMVARPAQVQVAAESNEAVTVKNQAVYKPCPVCKGSHTYTDRLRPGVGYVRD